MHGLLVSLAACNVNLVRGHEGIVLYNPIRVQELVDSGLLSLLDFVHAQPYTVFSPFALLP
jgi:hypothetical protein